MMWILIFSAIIFFNPKDKIMDLYQIPLTDIHGVETNLEQYRGKVLLIVNVASECGLTPQYEDLQKLYEMHADEGLVVLGFPSNDFMGQEPRNEQQILEFCSSNYGVSFPMFSKISVKGSNTHPLYEYLTKEKHNGKADSSVSWNFQKYLIDRNGELVEIISPRQRVLDDGVLNQIKSLL